LWLSLTFFCVVSLLTDRNPRRLRFIAGIGLATAAQALAWVAGVLLVVPLALTSIAVAAHAVRQGRSPLAAAGPIALGLTVGAGLCVSAYFVWGLQSLAIGVVTTGLAVSTGIAVCIGEGLRRTERRLVRTAAAVSVVCLASLLFVAVIYWSSVATQYALRGVGYFTRVTGGGISEASSVFAGPYGIVAGPFSMFGVLFFIAVPYLLSLTVSAVRAYRPALLALCMYTWYFLGLSAVQRRFTAEASLFVAVVFAVGALDIARRLGVITGGDILSDRVQRGESSALEFAPDLHLPSLYLLLLVGILVVAGSAVYVPVGMKDYTVDREQYGAAAWTSDYASQHDVSSSADYVFSPWNQNLMYNYFVSGDAPSYWYAKEHYRRFAASRDESRWYERLRDRGTGFVITHGAADASGGPWLHARLHRQLGSWSASGDGVAHFRTLYRAQDGTVTVFQPVQGVLLGGTAPGNSTVRIRTEVSIPGTAFTYTRRVNATAAGGYAVIVPYRGAYTVHKETGTTGVRVSESAVRNGETVGRQKPVGYWAFDSLSETGSNRFAIDSLGGNHGIVHSGALGPGIKDEGLALSGDGFVEIRDTDAIDDASEFTVSLWFRTDTETDYERERRFPRLLTTTPAGRYNQTDGYLIGLSGGRLIASLGNGSETPVLNGPPVADGQWHRATLAWNGTHCRLFVDGMRQAVNRCSAPNSQHPFVVGATTDRRHRFVGTIDEVRFRNRSLPASAIRTRYNQTRDQRASGP